MALTEEDLLELPQHGIDPANPGKYLKLLEDLQGNILKGHGRDHNVHLFLQFKPHKTNQVKKWISSFAQKYLKSAKQQADEAVRYKTPPYISGGVFANFLLSCKGYEYLEFEPFLIPSDQPFRKGMKNNDIRLLLGDPAVNQWEKGFQSEIHALVLIADDQISELCKVVNEITAELSDLADIVQRDDGFILKNASGQTVEHFGFVDGVSQPLFLKRDIDKYESDFSKWDPRAALDIILVKDDNGGEDSYGSYLVYRKLEQNVKKFRKQMRELGTKLEIGNDLAGAFIVGRFSDGTPVTISDKPINQNSPTATNNFNYDHDTTATKCPFHAHIRKTNPRGDTGRIVSSTGFDNDLTTERRHRIARRAVSYGENDITQEPETDSGMLFMCFQSNIENQFNFMQTRWANPNNFVQVNVGADPVIGQPQGKQKWPKQWDKPETQESAFELCVNMKGGEYFFAPSISFFKNLV